MSERLSNSTFQNIQLAPNSNPKHGDGLIYVGSKPLLVYDDGSTTGTSGNTGWFINNVGISGASSTANPQSIGSGMSTAQGGTGLRQTYSMESMRKLATSPILTSGMNRTTASSYPNRHEQYTNMGVIAQVKNVKGNTQQLRRGDVLMAVDDSLFNKGDENKLTNYIVGWSEVTENSTTCPILVYTGDYNSHKISYKLYNSANRTVYDLECPIDSEGFTEDGYGTQSKPLMLKISNKTTISNNIQSATSDSLIDSLVSKVYSIKQHSTLPTTPENFNFNYAQFEYNQGITLDVKYGELNVLNNGDIVIAKDSDGMLRGITTINTYDFYGANTSRDHICNIMVYSNQQVESGIKFYVVRVGNHSDTDDTMNIFPKQNYMYDLEVNYTFINDNNGQVFKYNLRRTVKQLTKGWIWFSNTRSNKLNKDSAERSLREILGTEVLRNVTKVKTQSKFSKRESHEQWPAYNSSSVSAIDNVLNTNEMCKLYVDKDCIWTYDAYPVVGNVSLNGQLNMGWNWIGFPSLTNETLVKTFTNNTLQNTEYIKGQKDFSTIDNGNPDLDFTLESGTGYKIKMETTVNNSYYDLHNETPDVGLSFPKIPVDKTFSLSKATYSDTRTLVTTSEWRYNPEYNSGTYLPYQKWNEIDRQYENVISSNAGPVPAANLFGSVVVDDNGIKINSTVVVNADYLNDWNHNYSTDFITISSLNKKMSINGVDRKVVGAKVLKHGYVINDNEVNDVNVTMDFQVEFAQDSDEGNWGDTSSTSIIKSLSELGIASILFDKQTTSDAQITGLNDIFEQSQQNNALQLKNNEGDILASYAPDIINGEEIEEHNDFGNIDYQTLTDDWSVWYPTDETVYNLIFTYDKKVQSLLIPSDGVDIDINGAVLDMTKTRIELGEYWAITHENEGIKFYYRADTDSTVYKLQASYQ